MGTFPAGIGPPDARKRACPVWGALDGNLLSKGSKALSFDPGAVQCPHCHSEQIVKRGKTDCGTQRYLCQNTGCAKGSFLLDYRKKWLRVFGNAEASRMGQGVGQQRHTRAMRSEKCVARRGRAWDGMRVIAVCFARGLHRCAGRVKMRFLLILQQAMEIAKTRNHFAYCFMILVLWVTL